MKESLHDLESDIEHLEAQVRMGEVIVALDKYCKGQITKSQALDRIYFSHREKPSRK